MSDESEGQRAAQQRHSQEIATERALMNATGLTRNQIRERLQANTNRFAENVQKRAAQIKISEPTQKIVAEEVKRIVDEFPPRRFVADGAVAPKPPGVVGADDGEWYNLTLCDGTTLDVRARNIVPL